MSITKDDVRNIAKLAALELSETELETMQGDLAKILEFVNHLSSADTDGIEPLCHVHGAVNAFRDDMVKESLSLEEVKENAPSFAHSGFRVPRII